jgi:hypothetical protein
MKSTLEKFMNASEPGREQGAFRSSRSRGKKRDTLFVTKDFWRALSSASLPQAPTLRRLHD